LKFNGTFNKIKGDFKLKKGTIASVYQLQSNNTYALVKTSVDSKPLDHIPPTYGRLALAYEKNKIFSEFYLIYNGWKKLDRYNPDGEDNAQYATSEGTPSWKTLNWRMGYDVNVKIKIQAAVENIFDVNYRFFASGFSAPGRNLVLSLRTSL
jgi:hemoglobin/transferrin/lactoferrin receptor protein